MRILGMIFLCMTLLSVAFAYSSASSHASSASQNNHENHENHENHGPTAHDCGNMVLSHSDTACLFSCHSFKAYRTGRSRDNQIAVIRSNASIVKAWVMTLVNLYIPEQSVIIPEPPGSGHRLSSLQVFADTQRFRV